MVYCYTQGKVQELDSERENTKASNWKVITDNEKSHFHCKLIKGFKGFLLSNLDKILKNLFCLFKLISELIAFKKLLKNSVVLPVDTVNPLAAQCVII